MTIEIIKQAAQALRDAKPELAAALEAMAAQEPVAVIAAIDEYGPVLNWTKHWIDVGLNANLYAAPIATPEHDAKVRDAALEEAAQLCERLGHGLDNWNRPYVRHHEVVQAMHRIRRLKSTGADHAK